MESPLSAERLMTPTVDNRGGSRLSSPPQGRALFVAGFPLKTRGLGPATQHRNASYLTVELQTCRED
jgi:hypothetical protein